MPALANDATEAGANDRAAILQYLLDVRDGRINNLALGTVTIGAAAGNTGVVTITNERSRALSYTAPSISPNNGFSVTAESCGTRSVPVGGSCTLTVRFLPISPPAETESRAATLSVSLSGTGGDPNPGLKSVSLSGTAQTSLEITAGPLSFTAVPGSTSASQPVTVTNRLGSNLRLCLVNPIAGLTAAAPDEFNLVGRTYDIAPRCTTLTSPGTSFDQSVTFSPPLLPEGPRFARLTVQRVSGVTLLDPVRSVDLEGNAGPFITIQGSGLTDSGKTLFSGVRQDVDAGATAPTVVRLTNKGSSSLRFSSVPLVVGTASAEYNVGGGCSGGSELSVDAFCDLSVTFNPSDLALRTAQLQISYADLAGTPSFRSPVVIDLRGQGTRGASLLVRDAGGTALATGSPVDFGRQNIAIAYTRRLTLTNTGSDEGLAISAPTTVPGAAGFDLVAPSGGGSCGPLATGFVLAANTSCAVDVRFSPTALTNYATNLTLPSRPVGALTPPINFALNLSGEGVDGRPTLQWQTAAGGALPLLEVPGITAVGSATPPQVSLRLANSGPGAAALQLLNVIGVDASSFRIEATGPGRCDFGNPAALLLEGTSCEVAITFRPQTAGAKAARLQLVSTGTTPAPVEIRAQASGPASTFALTAIPASIDLNSVRVGAQSAPATITLANDGVVPAVVTAVEASSGFAFEPGSCGALPFSIEPRGSCTLSIRFAPSSTGAASGSLRVQVSGVAAPVEVALQGTGAEAADVSGGGCSISDGRSPADPTLWTLILLATGVLFYRRRRRGRASHDGHPCQGFQ